MENPGESQAEKQPEKRKAALYIDAFNLYYAVASIGQNHLKWANLWKLGEILIPAQDEELVKVVFCTAYNKTDFARLGRHQKFVKALEHYGVTVILGHYTANPRTCSECGHTWDEQGEKETDVNFGLHLFNDARLGVFHHAYLLTADSDQAATVKMVKQLFPDKKLTTVVPPNRPISKAIDRWTDASIQLTADHFERIVMPVAIMDGQGAQRRVVVQRPTEYDPPPGWVHPNNRPK